jgi:molybdopterin-containing oxidoreductase family iron-sulfur binding subunit
VSDGLDRRRFLKVLGVTSAGVAAASCSSEPAEQMIPYLLPVEDQVPGVSTWYATTCRECAAGCGLHVRVREGRAVKVEGNPDHPINQGRLCARGQASLQGLYNPDRIRGPMERKGSSFEPIKWDDAIARVAAQLDKARGDRVWFLSGHETGTFDHLIQQFLSRFGSSNRVAYEPFGYEALRAATREVFGVDALPIYDFSAARYVISFGADFLETWLSPVEHSLGFGSRRATAQHDRHERRRVGRPLARKRRRRGTGHGPRNRARTALESQRRCECLTLVAERSRPDRRRLAVRRSRRDHRATGP